MRQQILSAKGLDAQHETDSVQEVWLPLVPHEVVVGDAVRVASSCLDDSQPRRSLSLGLRGIIKNIDADGDFELLFDDVESNWIFRKRSSLLLRRTCMATILHEID